MILVDARTNPYVGPRPFTRDELLPARDREILALRRTLISARILLLHSPSGAGKTSLIEAANGLRKAMEDRQFVVYPAIRVHHPPPRELRGEVNRYEFSALRSLTEDGAWTARGLAEYLAIRSSPAGSPDEEEDSAEPERRRRELLIFDQFEEVLTSDPADIEGRAEFFDRLAAVLEDPFRWALFMIREDFLGALAPWAKRLPTHLSAHYRIDLLRPEAARIAIREPALAQGVRFADDAMAHLIEELCRTTVQGLDGQTASQAGSWVEPVHLQVVCRRLWSQLAGDETEVTLTTVQSLGDVDASLAAFYSEQMASVAAICEISERRLRDWVATRLISSRGLRLQVMSDDAGDDEMSRVLAALASAHIVRAEERRGVRWYELAHDRLVEPVRRDNAAWEQANLHPMQLQTQLWQREGERPEYLLGDDALLPAIEWAALNADSLTDREEKFLVRSREQSEYRHRERQAAARLAIAQQQRLLAQFRSVRTLRIVALLLVVLVVAAGALAAVAWMKSEEARRQTEMAMARRDEVNALIKKLSESVAPLLGDLPGTVELQRELYGLIRETLEERADDVLEDPVYLNNRFVQQVNLGKFELAHGTLEAAIADFRAALVLSDAVLRRFPDDPEILRRKSVVLVNLGAAEMRRDETPRARYFFKQAMLLLDPPGRSGPLSEAMERNLAVALQQFGELEVRSGADSLAQSYFQRSLEIAQSLRQRDLDELENWRLLVSAKLRLGWLEAGRGQRGAALEHFLGALSDAEAMRRRLPLNAQVLRDVSLVCDNLGDLTVESDPSMARGYFDRSLEIAEVLARAEPDSTRSKFDLLIAHMQYRQLADEYDERHLVAAQHLLEKSTDQRALAGDPNWERVRQGVAAWERELATARAGRKPEG